MSAWLTTVTTGGATGTLTRTERSTSPPAGTLKVTGAGWVVTPVRLNVAVHWTVLGWPNGWSVAIT